MGPVYHVNGDDVAPVGELGAGAAGEALLPVRGAHRGEETGGWGGERKSGRGRLEMERGGRERSSLDGEGRQGDVVLRWRREAGSCCLEMDRGDRETAGRCRLEIEGSLGQVVILPKSVLGLSKPQAPVLPCTQSSCTVDSTVLCS